MRALLLASVFAFLACGPASNGSDGGTPAAPDGSAPAYRDGGTPDAASEGGTGTPCHDGDTEPCSGTHAGTCDPGTRACANGTWGPCDGRLQPQPGLCDWPNCADGGFNDGCQCFTNPFPGAPMSDYLRECHTQDAGTLGHGPCTSGYQICEPTETGSAWSDCLGEVVPQADDCSDLDLDCGANPAASCACTSGQTRPCGGAAGGSCQPGTQTCANGAWGRSCSGAVQPVKGDCAAPSCLSTAGHPVPNPGCECVSGSTRPCYTGPAGTEGQGTCQAGTMTCNDSGQWGPCVGETHPYPTCDMPSCTGTPLSACQ